MMTLEDLMALPLGTLVKHPNTARTTTYRRVEGGTGWAPCNLKGEFLYRGGLEHGRGTARLHNSSGMTNVTVIDQPKPPVLPKVKRSVLEARVAELEASLAEQGASFARLGNANIELRNRATEAERALRAEREKSIDLGTNLAAARTRVASLIADLGTAQRENLRLKAEQADSTRGANWDRFMEGSGPETRLEMDEATANNPLKYMKGWSYDDTRIVVLWACNSWKKHAARIKELETALNGNRSILAARITDLEHAERRIERAKDALTN